jgi:hypothetical protein
VSLINSNSLRLLETPPLCWKRWKVTRGAPRESWPCEAYLRWRMRLIWSMDLRIRRNRPKDFIADKPPLWRRLIKLSSNHQAYFWKSTMLAKVKLWPIDSSNLNKKSKSSSLWGMKKGP